MSALRSAPLLLALVACAQPTPPPTPADSADVAAAPTSFQDDPRLGSAFQLLGTGQPEACRALAQEVLDGQPGHPRAEFLVGLGLHKSKRYADARPHLLAADAATADFPGHEATAYFLAWCHYYLGEYELARAAFERHLETSVEADARFGLGVVALELGELETARTHLEQALVEFEAQVTEGNLTAMVDLAKCHARLADVDLAQDREDDALVHVEAALALDADKPAVWFKLYQLALARDDAATARRALGEYEARKPDPTAGMAMER
jgi:tetratricopeptide (TPR) repeat protein